MQQEYEYILKVYEEGNISKAAEKLFLTQPALSIAIHRIESSIGMPLFDRTRRPLQPTQAGKVYINMIKQMQELEFDLKRQMQDIRDLNTGDLKIGGSHYLNAYILPSILTAFSQKYPGIRLELIEDGSDQLLAMLLERELDLTFSCNTAFMDNLEKYPAFYDHVLLAVPVAHPVNAKVADARLSSDDIMQGKHLSADCPAVSLSHFRDIEFILLTPGNNLHDRCIEMFQETNFTPHIKLMLAQLATAYHLAASGYAATFISDRLIHTHTDRLAFYNIQSSLTKRQFYILLPNRNYTTHATKEFIRFFLANY